MPAMLPRRLENLSAMLADQRLVRGNDDFTQRQRRERDVARSIGAADQLADDINRGIVGDRDGISR